jgi:signal transduction histidine kinase
VSPPVRPTLRQLLLGAGVFALLLPLAAVSTFRLFDLYLLRQTERHLIAEAVLIGEAYRERLLAERETPPEETPRFRPLGREADAYVPIEPVLDAAYGIQPPAPPVTRRHHVPDSAEARAGLALMPLLARAQVFNLTGARVLGPDGCVVASTRQDLGDCLDELDEVRGALAGRYSAVARQRVSDEPAPPISSIRRRGGVRVFVAVPIFENGGAIGAVWMSRTAVAPLEMFWAHRNKIGGALLVCLVLAPAVSLLLARSIARPIRDITQAAEAVAHGRPRAPLAAGWLVPREIDQLSGALDRMAHQLTDRARYIAEFAANVSHELKTPLAGVLGATELLRDDADAMPAAQRERFLANIEDDARRMERLVQRLLELARVQNAPAESRRIELAPFVERLAARYAEPIQLDLTAAPAEVEMNPDHLESALRNLLDNAVRHGAGRPVRLCVHREGARVAFEVHDQGPGISPRNLSRVFERFFTTERERGGTGLGLAIVKAVAELRGGDVRLDSGPAGTRATLVV